MRVHALLSLSVLSLAACRQPALETAPAAAEVSFSASNLVAEMERRVNTGQADSIAASYLDDGLHVASGRPIVGRGAISEFWRIPAGATASMDFDVDAEAVSGDLAYAEGNWAQRFTPPGGPEQSASGRWSAVYRHTENGWKTFRSISYIVPSGPALVTTPADSTQ